MLKKAISLKNGIIILMMLLVLLQSVSLLVALFSSGVFHAFDGETFRFFSDNIEKQSIEFDKKTLEVVQSLTFEAANIKNEISKIAEESNIENGKLFLNNEAHDKAIDVGTNFLIEFLNNNEVTGAFIIFNGSNINKYDEDAHSAIYIRNSYPDNVFHSISNYYVEYGPSRISQSKKISLSSSWDVDMNFTSSEDGFYDFYHKPIDAIKTTTADGNIKNYGYWSAPVSILDDKRQVITYTLPLIDNENNIYGVMGFEISMTYFYKKYLPNHNIPFEGSFCTIANVKNDVIDLDVFIPGGVTASQILHKGDKYAYYPLKNTIINKTEVENLGNMYLSIVPLGIYNEKSAFYDENWALVGFVNEDVISETSRNMMRFLVGSIVVTSVISFIAAVLIAVALTRDISTLPAYISKLSADKEISFKKTGYKEINELTTAIEVLNKSVMNSSKNISKIMELTGIPMGCFEMPHDSDYVFITEYIRELIDLEDDKPVTKDEWSEISNTMKQNPVDNYADIYSLTDKSSFSIKYLRIIETYTDTNKVGVITDVTEDVEKTKRLEYELDYDSLTKLFSRQAFYKKSARLIGHKPGKKGALVFADLDSLKYINDSFGHDVGDKYIIKASEKFADFSNYDAIVARISGDEFAIYLHGFDDYEHLRDFIYYQLDNKSQVQMVMPDGNIHRIRSSVGISFYPKDAEDISGLMKYADYAMYEAKNKRKGFIFEFKMESYLQNYYLLDKRESINYLIDGGLIKFVFQPIVDLNTGEIYAYEALMRSMIDDFKSPLEIISVAAAESKLYQIENLTMTKSLEYIAHNYDLFKGRKLFINSLPSQNLSSEDFRIISTKYGHIFKNVVIEVTEGENDDLSIMDSKINKMRELGALIAIDDFGAGYSNELRILSINPDIIKIDMDIIRNINESQDKRQLVANIVSYCKPKRIKIIAEGVENYEELLTIKRLGIDYVQGYFLAKPACPPESIKKQKTDIILSMNCQ